MNSKYPLSISKYILSCCKYDLYSKYIKVYFQQSFISGDDLEVFFDVVLAAPFRNFVNWKEILKKEQRMKICGNIFKLISEKLLSLSKVQKQLAGGVL